MPIQCKQPLHQMRDGVDAMAYLNAETYREREAQWREQAAYLPPGREQQVCLALAEGYADLITLLGRPAFSDAAQAGRTLKRPAPSARAGAARKEQPRRDPLPEPV
jgi:hypothetical protein